MGKKPDKTKDHVNDKNEHGLTPKQDLFCRLYAGDDFMDVDLFGNGTQCYIEVYKPKKVGNWYNSARSSASRLLTNVNVIDRVNKLLEEGGFNDQNVDRQHLFLINQHSDFKTKMVAIKEYNSLKNRIKRAGDSPEHPLHIIFDPSFSKD